MYVNIPRNVNHHPGHRDPVARPTRAARRLPAPLLTSIPQKSGNLPQNPEFNQKNLETIPKNLEVSFAWRSFSIVLQVLRTFIYPNVHILSDVLQEPPPPLPRIFFYIRAVESWVLVGLEVDDETSPVVPCRMTGIRP